MSSTSVQTRYRHVLDVHGHSDVCEHDDDDDEHDGAGKPRGRRGADCAVSVSCGRRCVQWNISTSRYCRFILFGIVFGISIVAALTAYAVSIRAHFRIRDYLFSPPMKAPIIQAPAEYASYNMSAFFYTRHRTRQQERAQAAPSVMLVVASAGEDVSWIDSECGSLYYADMPFPIPHRVYSARNKSHLSHIQTPALEATAFLHYIVDEYATLPERIVFLHGHRSSWHSPDTPSVLQRLRYELSGYHSLNFRKFYTIDPAIDDDEDNNAPRIKRFWAVAQLAADLGEAPSRIADYCCAQFMVSRDRITARSLSFWQRLYDFSLRPANMSSYEVSRAFEHTWHIIMGESAVMAQGADDGCDIMHCQTAMISKTT